jgi:putative transposase
MDTSTAPSYRGYRFPCQIIAHCVWLYFRFNLSFRDIQEMMLERGVEVSHEAIRLWCLKFGTGDTWHLDEVFCKINGRLVYLWRAVDQSGEVLDVLVQKRRDAKAAKRCRATMPRSRMSCRRSPIIGNDELNNRAENSHQPTRERERGMRRFESMRHAQRFLSVHAQVSNHFRPGRHLMRACNYRALMTGRFASWSEITGARNSAEVSS